MSKYGIVKITASGEVELLLQSSESLELHLMQQWVGGYIEVVPCVPFLGPAVRDVRMVLDEEGKLKDKPCNVIASALYGTGEEIVGDVFLCLQKVLQDGEQDIVAMPKALVSKLYKFVDVVRLGILQQFGTLEAHSVD